ncbi:MAG TPA: hypothetical protein VGI68_08280 [Mycobacterium sp.]|jgi:hypothetical protein
MKKSIVVAAALAAGIACAPLAQADADTSNLDQIVAGVYNQVQARCTPSMPPSFQRIQWDAGMPYGGGGTGRIIDANPRLGGPFTVYWNLGPNPPAGARSVPAYTSSGAPHGYWDVTLEFC